jgi:ubiquinone/menaquinone biosynthesis C-methylase UbiE
MSNGCECESERCSVSKCDIFDFMAKHVGMTVIHPGGFKATRQLADCLSIKKESKVLDIACGKGTTALYLAKNYGCEVTGIDISEDLVREAKTLAREKKLENKVTFRVGDAMQLSFPDNTFDAAISQAMLVLVKDKTKTIEEAVRVVKQGGRAGWLELSWRKKIDAEFLDKVSNVLCAYCMTNVSTYSGWEKIFNHAGAGNLKIIKGTNVSGTLMDRVKDEGLLNTMKMMYRTLKNKEIRDRSKKMNRFFKEYDEYFGLGIYIFEK